MNCPTAKSVGAIHELPHRQNHIQMIGEFVDLIEQLTRGLGHNYSERVHQAWTFAIGLEIHFKAGLKLADLS